MRVKSDEQLVREVLEGAEEAFAVLVTRYQQRLLRFLMARAATRADAEDALQDTFVNAYRYLSSFDPRWRFSTWLYRIGIRNLQRVARREEVVADGPFLSDDDPLRECVAHSERENLWLTAKTALTADAYTALWLRYAEDMSIREVAMSMGRTTAWAKVTLMRARRRLQTALLARAANTGDEVYG